MTQDLNDGIYTLLEPTLFQPEQEEKQTNYMTYVGTSSLTKSSQKIFRV